MYMHIYIYIFICVNRVGILLPTPGMYLKELENSV
jgi:hypothetical protein